MQKKKVQVAVYYRDDDSLKYFLLLKMNERRHGHWQNITGGVEKNEDFLTAAYRELNEETSISKDDIKQFHNCPLVFKFTDQWENDVIENCFIVELNNKIEILLDPNEHQAFSWVNENEIKPTSVHYKSNYDVLIYGIENL